MATYLAWLHLHMQHMQMLLPSATSCTSHVWESSSMEANQVVINGSCLCNSHLCLQSCKARVVIFVCIVQQHAAVVISQVFPLTGQMPSDQ